MKRAAVLALAFLVLACHRESSVPAEKATAPDPCSLMTTDEVRHAAGLPVRDGESGGDETSTRRCTWREGGEAGAGAVIVAIHVENLDPLMGQLRNMPMNEPIAALGDEAYWSNALSQLTIRAGARVITVNFTSSGNAADHKAAALEMAKIILPKL